MVTQDHTQLSEGGKINHQFGRTSPEFNTLDDALARIAEAAAEAGNTDDADWTDVYAAIADTHRLFAEQRNQ